MWEIPAAAAAAQSPAATCSPLLLRQSSLPHLRPSPLAIKIFNYEGISLRPRLPVHHLIRALRPPQTPMDRPSRYESGAPECILTNLPRGKRHAHDGCTCTIDDRGLRTKRCGVWHARRDCSCTTQPTSLPPPSTFVSSSATTQKCSFHKLGGVDR